MSKEELKTGDSWNSISVECPYCKSLMGGFSESELGDIICETCLKEFRADKPE